MQRKSRQGLTCRSFRQRYVAIDLLNAGDVFARAGVNADNFANLYE